jgi:hypothetical protein
MFCIYPVLTGLAFYTKAETLKKSYKQANSRKKFKRTKNQKNPRKKRGRSINWPQKKKEKMKKSQKNVLTPPYLQEM